MSHYCDICNIVFKSKINLQNHKNTMRHKNRISNSKPNHTCDCGKFYTQQSSYYRHKKTCKYVKPQSRKENQETQEVIQVMREEINELKSNVNELKSKLNKLEGKSTNNFTIVQQGRRKVNKNIRNELIIKQDNKCNHCDNVLSQYYQVDHITALQYGGNDEFDNLQALCCECHAKKSSIENVVRDKIRNAIVDIIKTESVSSTNF